MQIKAQSRQKAYSARSSALNAHNHNTDAQVVYGCTGFALEHLRHAMKAIGMLLR
jgi:hypothetical protein